MLAGCRFWFLWLWSRPVMWLMHCTVAPLNQCAIRWWIKKFDITLDDAILTQAEDYSCIQTLFTRQLAPGARPVPSGHQQVASPADGYLRQWGAIKQGHLIQAKGVGYTVAALLNDVDWASTFDQGHFMTHYLSPRDYHRVHMPCDGTLVEMMYIPGKLRSVQQKNEIGIPGLYTNNERMVAIFDTPHGMMAVVMVGALLVGGIHTAWHGQVTPCARMGTHWCYDKDSNPITLSKGDELGFFTFGSTTVVLFESDTMNFESALKPDQHMLCGEWVASFDDGVTAQAVD